MNPVLSIYRVSRKLYRLKLYGLSKTFDFLNRLLFSVWLPGSATIGTNFTIGYLGLGIVVHNQAVIGNNVWICQHVTIGRNFGDIQVPRIEDNVYIGANCTIIGNITVGKNAIIGCNTVVNKSVPPNSTAAGNPMRIVSTNNSHNHLMLRQRDKLPANL